MIGPTIRQGREAKQQDKAGRQSVQEQSKKATAFSSSATKMNMNDLSGSAKRLSSSSSAAGRNQATAQRQPGCRHQRLIVALFCVLSVAIWLLSVSSVECHIKRTQYHEQGLHGPKSYKFGFTAGDHKNPQQRHEVSDGHGHVKGWYSFVDANGKHQVVHYEADPKYGFKVFNHKEKAYNNGKRHYNS